MSESLVVCFEDHGFEDRGRFDARTGETWRQCADVLYGCRPRSLPDAVGLIRKVLERYPGCALAMAPSTDGCWVARARPGTQAVVGPLLPRQAARTTVDVVRLASALYASLLPECSRLRLPHPCRGRVTRGRSIAPPGGARRLR